jgi:hypothetical protein
MKIGFFAIGLADLARPEILTAAATTAERVGFSTLWTGEHIVFVEKIESAYPYAREATAPPVPTDLPILSPFVALGYAAAVTKQIRLATGVCLVPEYNPLLLAKLAASLDFVSSGRFVEHCADPVDEGVAAVRLQNDSFFLLLRVGVPDLHPTSAAYGSSVGDAHRAAARRFGSCDPDTGDDEERSPT